MKSKAEQLEFPHGLSRINKDGSETPDPRPLALPVGFERPESIQELIQRLVRDPAIRAEMDAGDIDTFDDADDFEIPDDIPQSPHEENFDPLHLLSRDQELRSGTVRDRSPEELEVAKATIEKHRKPKANPVPPPVVPTT